MTTIYICCTQQMEGDESNILTKNDSFDEEKGYLIPSLPQITPWRCLILMI